MNYQQLQQHINSLEIPHRGDCPYCHNKNTFVANLVDGQILYYCYQANCKLKGRLNHVPSLEEINNNARTIRTSASTSIFVVPNHWQNPLQNKRCYNFLKYWNILDVYIDRLVDIYYDPKQERCVFLIKDLQGGLKGATGRHLYSGYPKWYIYSRLSDCPGLVLKDKAPAAILVEDFISACAATFVSNAIALLGTNLTLGTIQYLLPFRHIFIALDKDATGKSLKLQHQLSPHIKSTIIPLETDIKYYKKEQLEELKRNVSSYL